MRTLSGSADEAVDEERPRPVSVLVVDDNDVIRQGLRSLLESAPQLVVVGEAGNGEEALEVARRVRPDVVLLDVRMPRRDGISAAQELAGRCRILMLTFSDEPSTIREALLAGAAGYLVHGQFDADELVGSVLNVARGSGVFSPPAVEALRASLADPAPVAVGHRSAFGLTERELEVMDLVATGLSNSEVANRCYVSEKTVKNHVNHIFAKLHVTSRAEAVSLWLGGQPAT